MPSILASTRNAAAKATLNFDWQVPFKPSFSLKEVAAMTGLSDSFIEKLFDEGSQIAGHEYNGGKGERMTKRIPRLFVITLLVKSAKYDAETRVDAIISCLREFKGHELLNIAEAARQLAVKNGN
jgi:hypothetical protein